jgi:hypothetical protein
MWFGKCVKVRRPLNALRKLRFFFFTILKAEFLKAVRCSLTLINGQIKEKQIHCSAMIPSLMVFTDSLDIGHFMPHRTMSQIPVTAHSKGP